MEELTEKRGCCTLKAEALDRNLLRTRLGRGNGPVVSHNMLAALTDLSNGHCDLSL